MLAKRLWQGNTQIVRQQIKRLSSRQLPPPISLTETAASRIKDLMDGKEDVEGLRIGVKRRGCSGYSYNLNYVKKGDATISKDELVKQHGVNVFVDPKAVFFIVGTEMDYVETDIASEFTFRNPNSKGECGCGESFNM